MSKRLYLLLTLPLLCAAILNAQTTTHQISAGPGYAQSGYYKFSDGTGQQVPHDAWDLAFSNLGAMQAGIFFNESTASSMGFPTAAIEAYDPFVFDFSEKIDPADLSEDLRIYNPETTWATGAFNSTQDTSNSFDYGWGTYNPALSKITGYRVFAIKLRNGQYRKIMFDEYDGSTYTFRVADLDGANEETKTINTDFGNGSPVIYFSFTTGTNVTTPTAWDMVFCRYVTPLFDGTEYIPYEVTGILVNDGILTAKAKGIDPATVDYVDYLDSLHNIIGTIGHEWKYFSGVAWSLIGDVAYFVKTKDNKLYKVVFVGFTGSGAGVATFEQTYLGELTSAPDLPAGIQEVLVYPNPVTDRLSISFTAEMSNIASMNLINAAGQIVWSGNSHIRKGLNVLEIRNLPALPTGNYFLNVQVSTGQFSRVVTVGQ